MFENILMDLKIFAGNEPCVYLDSSGVDEGEKVLEVCVADVAEENDRVLVTRGVLQQILHMQTY